jgi:hypothetical protein
MPVLQAVRGDGGAGMSDMQMISRGIEGTASLRRVGEAVCEMTRNGKEGTSCIAEVSDLNPGF